MRTRRTTLFLVALLELAAFKQPLAQGRQGGPPRLPPGVAVLPYQRVDWPLPASGLPGFPDGPWKFLDVPSVAVTPDHHVLVLCRAPHAIIEFDEDGKFIRSFGDGLFANGRVRPIPQAEWVEGHSHFMATSPEDGCPNCGAHAVRLDPQGNLWLIDASGHVVYKMTREGKELMRLGKKDTSGTDTTTFNLPTDVAFGANGQIYVSDGYGSARVVEFDRDGKYVRQWGIRGKGPGEFGLPHNLVTDAQGKVYVNDRDNQRIEIFDPDGKFLAEWTGIGSFNALNITKDQKIWTGGVLRTLDGKAVGTLPDVPFHGMAVAESGDVFFSKSGGILLRYVK